MLEELRATWRFPAQEGKVRHTLSYLREVTDDKAQTALPLSFQIRVVCHMLLDQMPEASLREVLESLATIYEFHRIPLPRPVLPSPPVRVPVKIGRTYESPAFHVVEE